MTSQVTLVSAFLSNVNERDDRLLDKYYELGKVLLKTTINKIIFLDEIMYELINNKDNNYNKDTTLLIKINKKDIYFYQYIDYLTYFDLNTQNKKKDTMEYIFTQCNKTEWVKEAILLNYFNTENFIWVDFGIRHIFKLSNNEEFINKINNLQYKVYDNIRIGNIWNLDIAYSINIYKDIAWYFAGGVFGGNKNNLIKFSELMRSKCIEIMTKKNTIMWEVNIWYLIYIENRDLFDNYTCDHNNTLIDNY